MPSQKHKITEVRAAYIYQVMDIPELSRTFDVSINTLRRWKKQAQNDGDDWDRARTAARLSRSGIETVTNVIMEDFMLVFQRTMLQLKESKDIKPQLAVDLISSLADSYSKTINSVAKGNPKLDKLSFASDLLRELIGYVTVHYPQHIGVVEEILMPFSEELSRRYG